VISFVIPAHNEELLLGGTLRAIHDAARGAGLVAYEIVVADDASTDGTVEVARSHGARVVSIDRRHISAARNGGARAALGDPLIFVDADTHLTAEALAGALGAMEQGAIAGGGAVRFDGEVPRYARVMLPMIVIAFRLARLTGGCFFFCRREGFDEVGGWDESVFAGEEVNFAKALKRRFGRRRFTVLREAVVTSGRKLRAYAPREMFRQMMGIAFRGQRAVRTRDRLGLWYGPRRPDPAAAIMPGHGGPSPMSNTPLPADAQASQGVSTLLNETRVFPPQSPTSLGFTKWHVPSMEEYRELHRRSIEQPEAFWAEEAKKLAWFAPWSKVLEWNAPDAKWFIGGRINACYNCVDRHVQSGHGEDVAIIWEGEPVTPRTSHPAPASRYATEPEVRRITYRELQEQTSRCANALRAMGVKKGDVVTVYMPMIPELAVAVLACARIGAAHSVIFGGFAPHAITERAVDAHSRIIITADGGYRRGEVVPLQKNVEEACKLLANQGHIINHVLVVKRTGHEPPSQRFKSGDAPASAGGKTPFHWWHDTVDAASDACPCESMDSEDMLFLLYTSGSTGKPKGIQHTTGGYLTFVNMTARLTFNLNPDAAQIFWCSADVGWITGHSYVLYGLLMNRVPTLMYEGAPNFPANDRFWEIIARHRVTQFYTAPTAIRTFMKWGDDLPAKHDMSSLRILGTVGEPINPEAWIWYHTHIGRTRCPIVDTYWQTETGGHIVTPLPGAIPTKPGSCTLPMLGIDAAIVNEQGEEMPANSGGLFCIRKPWPGMLRGVYGNRERFVSNYWGRLKDPKTGALWYFSADGARRDADGYFWIQGRVDDVIKVSGHLLGTMEVESALVSHPAVAEAAVVGYPHEIKGNAICAFVTLRGSWQARNPGRTPDDELRKELTAHVAKEVGALAKPDQIRFADGLPKTRSGKIMRRLLRDVAAGVEKITQDTTTLEDFSVVAKLRADEE
jgi:acetyl-CoA synthetase